MLARPAPSPGEGLLLTPCSSVHMYGMRFPLDVAFLDRGGAVVAIYPSLTPGSRTRWHRNGTKAPAERLRIAWLILPRLIPSPGTVTVEAS